MSSTDHTAIFAQLVDEYSHLNSSLDEPKNSASKDQLITKLATAIKQHKFHYYQGQPHIDDAAYDELESMLLSLSPHHPILQHVGYNHFGKIKHVIPMLSLEKVRDYPALITWARKHHTKTREAHNSHTTTLATYKLDGISLSLVYAERKLLIAKTRGDGEFGEDVTTKVHNLDSIPRTLNFNPPQPGATVHTDNTPTHSHFEIRGELCCSKSNFLQLTHEMINRQLKPPASERNIVAGILGRKDHLDLARYFTFLAFSVDNLDLFHLKHQLYQLINHNNLPTLITTLPQLSPYLDTTQLNQLQNLAQQDPPSLLSKIAEITPFSTETQKLTFLKDQGFTLPPVAQPPQLSEQKSASISTNSLTHSPTFASSRHMIPLPHDEPMSCVYQHGELSMISMGRLSIAVQPKPLFKVPPTITADELPSRVKILGHVITTCSAKQITTIFKQITTPSAQKLNAEQLMFQTVIKLQSANSTQPKIQPLIHQFLSCYEFHAYGITSSDDGRSWLHETDRLHFFQHNSFAISPQYTQFVSYLRAARHYSNHGDFCIDGVVLSINDATAHQRIGYTSHHPKYRICYKWQGAEKLTAIDDLLWEVSRTGFVSPIALLKPVVLSGATIRRVSLHNYRYFMKLVLRKHDEVFVIRSGDVIPKITRIKRHHSQNNNPLWQAPTHCPECGTQLTYDLDSTDPSKSSEAVALICPNSKHCPPQLTGTINHWCRSVKIYDLSHKRIRQFIDIGLLTSIADLYTLKIEQLENLDGMGSKMAAKIITSINSAKTLSLIDILVGLGITGMQKTMATKIATTFHTMDTILELDPHELDQVAGLAHKSATTIVNELQDLKPLIHTLYQHGVSIS